MHSRIAAISLVVGLTAGCGAASDAGPGSTTQTSSGTSIAPTQESPGPSTGGAPSSSPLATATQSAANPAGRPREHRRSVLLISVDGLNPDAIDSSMPGFSRLRREGASTLNARTQYEATETLPNHTGMLTTRSASDSGVRFNEDNGGTLKAAAGDYVPGIFDIAHDHGLRTAFLAEKGKFRFLIRSWDDTHGAEDRNAADNGRDKIDTDLVAEAGVPLRTALEAIRTSDLTFLHIRWPDSAGHASGWMSPSYIAAVRRADTEISALLDDIAAKPALADRMTVIVTADHGGVPHRRSHADPTNPADYRIPFFVWGAGVRPGADLYATNRGLRVDPGAGRPDYRGMQPIRNLDAANLVLRLLGLPQLPGGASRTQLRTR